jgi:hypothetical protein
MCAVFFLITLLFHPIKSLSYLFSLTFRRVRVLEIVFVPVLKAQVDPVSKLGILVLTVYTNLDRKDFQENTVPRAASTCQKIPQLVNRTRVFANVIWGNLNKRKTVKELKEKMGSKIVYEG